MKIGVVIAAAGTGKRMGGSVKKQFLLLQNKPVLLHTLALFVGRKEISEIVIVTGLEDLEKTRNLVKEYPFVQVVPGGKERQDSVFSGLKSLKDCDYAFVHDGARPFVSREAIDRLIETMRNTQAVVLAVPVKDTIKQVDDQGVVVNTPPRKSLWAVQTPQAFHLPVIMDAYIQAEKAGYYGTDDASLVEFNGGKVSVVMGEYTNIKLTTPDDLWLGEMILRKYAEKESQV